MFDQSQESGEAHEIDPCGLQAGSGFLLGFGWEPGFEAAAIDETGRDAVVAGALEDECVWII